MYFNADVILYFIFNLKYLNKLLELIFLKRATIKICRKFVNF